MHKSSPQALKSTDGPHSVVESGAAPSSPRHPILEAKDLERSYGPRLALRGLSFSLEPGHVLGFLGPNGAGKTTTIRILTTMLQPSAGHFSVAGIGCEHPDLIRRRIGVLPESLGFPRHITGIEYLTFFGQLYGRSASTARANGMALLKDVRLDERAKSLIGSYSHGMRQRLGIARALVNEPLVVFLDEPTLGLDPRGQQELLALVGRIARERNVGVILCSHLLSEIEGVCDDVVILSSGQVVAKGSVAEVIGGAQRNVIRVQVPPPSVPRAAEVLQAVPGVSKVTSAGQAVGWLRVDLVDPAHGASSQDHHVTNGILEALIRDDVAILGFEAQGGRLQEVFFHLTERVAK